MRPRSADRWLGALLLAAVFLLATVKVADTDAWTHLALGRNLVAERGFPPTEPLVFPGQALPYYNPEWLFGLVLYLAWAAAGAAGVVLLKAAVVTAAFLVLLEDSRLGRDRHALPTLEAAAVAAVLLAVAVVARYRFVERPDIVLMLFLAFTIYGLNAYVWHGRRWLYALPALGVLWVNMHPSVVVGLVPFAAVLGGGALQRLLLGWRGLELPGTPSRRQLGVVAAVLGGFLLASLANPYGLDPLVAPFRLAGAAWWRAEVAELQPPTLAHEPAVFVLVLVLALALVASVRRLPLIAVFLVTPFVILGLSALRFVFLLAIVAAPVLARQARLGAARLPAAWARRLGAPVLAAVAVGGATLVGLSVAGVGPFALPLARPGLGVNAEGVPEGALRYLDRVGAGGRVLNTFHFGGYIAWRDLPRRVPAVDGRGYLPPGLLDALKIARTDTGLLERLRSTYGFEIAVLTYPILEGDLREEMPDVDAGLGSPDWALVYWDDLALVYLRRAGPFAPVVSRDEYVHVKPASGGFALARKLREGVPLAAIEAELERNIAGTGSSTAHVLLGFAYNEVGLYAKAIDVLSRVRDVPPGSNLPNAYQALGLAYFRLGDARKALGYFTAAERFGADPILLYNVGYVLASLGRDREAIGYLERALGQDPHLTRVYPPLIAAYRRAGRVDQARRLEAEFPRALVREKAWEHFRRGVRLHLEGRLPEAVAELTRCLRLDPGQAGALSVLGLVYLDLDRLDEAEAAQRRALGMAPRLASAHYGLAAIHERRGARAQARAHFTEYLRLEPRGFWSPRAREALARLSGS